MNNNSGTLEKVLRTAAEAVLAVDSGKTSLDDLLDHADENCRRSLEHLLLNFFRFRKSIRPHWQQFCTRSPEPFVAALLDCTLSQSIFQDAIAAQSSVNVAVTVAKWYHADKFVNAVLRKALQTPWQKPVNAAGILPSAILHRWQKMFAPEQVEDFARLFTCGAPFTFRLCRDVRMPENCQAIPGEGNFRFASGSARAILNSPEFARGEYYIQDPAASLAVALAAAEISRAGKVLDLCAAPGGKSLMIGELLSSKGCLTAADRSRKRQQLTRENFNKHGFNAQIITATPDRIRGQFDLVLADVPCSNSGVFRRRPDALWRFSENSLAQVMELQKTIITQAAQLVAPGGTLICSTCSIEKDENNTLTTLLPGFSCREQQTILPDDLHDGAFAAKLIREK